ncbi:MAG: ABC transporter ATP-binding protein [Acidimicrobiaceae bacterium]|nr:ABC transporter ATP-binding protein [Acidimicrobiaceae bacterium]
MRTVRAFRSRRDRRHADPAAPDDLARNGRDRHWPGARSIILDGISHSYTQAPPLGSSDSGDLTDEISGSCYSVQDLSLHVAPGESVALLGPSGCGKTTLLRLIAGLERPLDGTIQLGDRFVSGPSGRGGTWVAPESRRVGMVFQDWALFPHLTVGRNVGYGLERSKRTPDRIAEALELVGLGGFAERMPATLSGGQQQRVALARALAPRPGVLLLDEPFSNLDSSLREDVRSEVRRLLIELGITAVFVTHDQDEAFVVGDRVGVLCEGRLAQIDTPDGLYRRPTDPFVADFVGTASWLRCTASGGVAHTTLGRLPLGGADAANTNGTHSDVRAADAATDSVTGPVDVMLRPEQLRLAPGTAAEVELVEFYGHDSMVVANLDGTHLRVRCGPDPNVRRGDVVAVEFIGTDVVAFAPRGQSAHSLFEETLERAEVRNPAGTDSSPTPAELELFAD